MRFCITSTFWAVILVTMMAVVPNGVAAKPPLRDVAEIDNGILAVAIADELRKTCDDLSARMIRAYSTLEGLKSRAKNLGYTSEEIEDYVTSKAEKKRMRAKGEAYLKSQGVTVGDAAGYCALGRTEIANNSAIGRLLRAK